MFKNKKTIIFDFDGTIADTFYLHEKSFHQSLGGYPVLFRYEKFAGMSTSEAMQRIFTQNGFQIDTDELNGLIKQKQKMANALYRESIQFMPGALPFIKQAHESGFCLVIASSGSRVNVNTGVEALQIGHLFDYIITSDDVEKAKPDPAIFLYALNRSRTEASEALVIEDAISGIMAANAAGIEVVCIDKKIAQSGNHPALYKAKDFDELLMELQKDAG